MTPSQHFETTPYEMQVLIEARRPKVIGGIHEDDLERMEERRQEFEAKGIKVL